MQRLKIALLGPPLITLDNQPVETDRHKAIALLAYLAVEAKTHRREALAALLWPDYPRASAYSYLRRTMWELNQMLGKGWVEADRENVRLLRNESLEVDVELFERYVTQTDDNVTKLSKAVELYRGDFLEGFVVADTAPFEEWQTQQAEVYRLDLAKALKKLVAAHESEGKFGQSLAYAQRWLSLDRLNENAYRAVMRQMAGMGDRSGAIRIYQACQQTLKEELGVIPQAETQRLYQDILNGEAKPEHAQKPVTTTIETPIKVTGNLPVPTTPFIGRREEIRQICKLALDEHIHLLTLSGPGGTGKTRLATQAATEVAKAFRDGAWFIPLAAVQTAQGIIPAIAQGLNFSFYNGEETQRQQLLDYLREKHLLLVMDNFEQLLAGGRELVTDILATATRVKLLITSREHLNLQSEQVFHVAGMRIPNREITIHWLNPEEESIGYSGIQLMVERARRVKPGFQLNQDNLQAVTQICQMVDGSPLGIELAAVWLELLPEEEIAKEIAHSLDFLESNSVDAPLRQHSLRMVFDTSWRLLNAEEQQAFRRLCAFRGSFSREAGQVVSGASLRTLLSLANKSWLEQNEGGRFQLHEVLRQYGLELLKADKNEWQETKNRQKDFYCDFLVKEGKALLTAEQARALNTIKPEMESNIPDVCEWLVSNGCIEELIDRILPGIFHFWLDRDGSFELVSLLKSAQDVIPRSTERKSLLQYAIVEALATSLEISLFEYEDHPKERLEQLWRKVDEFNLKGEMGIWYVLLVATYGAKINYQEASKELAEVLMQFNEQSDPWEVGNCYLLAGYYYDSSLPYSRETCLLKALEIFKTIGVLKEQGSTLRSLGNLAASRVDYEKAIEYTLEAQAYFEQVGDEGGIEAAKVNLGEYYIYLGKIQQAFNVFEELRHHNEKIGNLRRLGTGISWESLQVARYGNLELALKLRQRSLAIAWEVGNQNDIVWATWELGEIYRLMGDEEKAMKYYQEALPAFEKMQELNGLGFYHRGCADIAAMQGNWVEAVKEYHEALVYHEREKRGNREWGLALTYARLGMALARVNQKEEARHQLKKALASAVSWINPDLKALPLVGIATWLTVNGDKEKGIELAACVASKSTTWNEVKAQARKIVDEAKTGLSIKDVRAWEKRGEGMSIDEACQMYAGEDRL